MEAFVGVVLGGVISIVTTLTVDAVRARRELRRRWDDDALDAIAGFIESSNRAIGAMFDEGRSRGHGDPEARVETLDRAARAAFDSVRIAHARARLLLGPLERELAGYRNTLDKLKELGSRGFPEADPEWKSVQSQLGRDLDDLLAAATALLQLRPTMT